MRTTETLSRLRSRLTAAGALLSAAVDELGQVRRLDHAGHEVGRRALERESRALAHLLVELIRRLQDLRLELGPDACPHCGWAYGPPVRCARCGKPKGAGDDPPPALPPVRPAPYDSGVLPVSPPVQKSVGPSRADPRRRR